MVDPSEVYIAYQKQLSKEVEREYYDAYIKGRPGEELTLLSTDNEQANLVTCIIRGRFVSGTVVVGPSQSLEAVCAVHFACLIER